MNEYIVINHKAIVCIITAYSYDDAYVYAMSHNIKFDDICDTRDIMHYSAYDVN